MPAVALAALAALALAIDPRSQLTTLERRREAEATAARLLADQERSVFDELQRAEEAVGRAQQELAGVEQARNRRRAGAGRGEPPRRWRPRGA